MSVSGRDGLPVVAEVKGMYEGRGAEWGDMTVAFEKIAAGDPGPLYRGLPDDRCQCPHWGFLFKGKVVVRYADREEEVNAGEAYYMAPGHTPLFLEDSETLEYSPTAELGKTMAAIERNLAAQGTDAAK